MTAIRTAILACVFCCVSAVSYSAPITAVTYDFTATLNAPINGSNQVSGSFSFFPGVPGFQVGTEISGSSPYPGTLDIGNQVLTSPASGPNSTQAIFVNDLGTSDSFSYSAQFQDGVNSYRLGIDLVDPTGKAFGQTTYDAIPTLNLPEWGQQSFGILLAPADQDYTGRLTSLQLEQVQAVPEPGTLLVFSVLGIGVLARRLRSPIGAGSGMMTVGRVNHASCCGASIRSASH
jgi:hypothetical protein